MTLDETGTPTVVLSVRVSRDLLDTLNALGLRHGRTKSQIAEWMLECGVADYYERRTKGMLPDPPAVRSRAPKDAEVRRSRSSKGGMARRMGLAKRKGTGNG